MVFMKYFFLFFVVVVKSIFAECCGCCKDCCPFFGKKDVRILMLGLDGAGKTTIFYQLKVGENCFTKPTLECNSETIKYKNFNFTIVDVGGSDNIRKTWKNYYDYTDGLIFVVDSSNKNRIADANAELNKLLKAEELKHCPVLVYANKQDLNGALSPGEVTKRLGMGDLIERTWLVQGATATTGQGLIEGLDWMAACF